MTRQDDSGLRAGFVREDSSSAKEAQERRAAEVEKETASRADEQNVAAAEHAELSSEQHNSPEVDEDSPTVTMQGVSGKKIKGTVKVVKVRKKQAEPDDAASEEQAQEPAAQDEKTQVEAKPAPEVEKVEPQTVEPAAEDKPAAKATPKKAEEATVEKEEDSEGPTIPTVPAGPRPRKIKAGDGTLPTAPPKTKPAPKRAEPKRVAKAEPAQPRKVKSGSEAGAASKKAETKAPEKKDEPVQIIPSVDDLPRPRKIGSLKDQMAQEADRKKEAAKPAATPSKPAAKKAEEKKTEAPAPKREEPPRPKKIASGSGKPVMGRKISSGEAVQQGEASASLAATAELFAQRKAEREAARDKPQSGRRRQQGRRPASASGPRRGQGGFDKDKDEDQRPRVTQSPRKPKPERRDDELTALLGRSATPARNKFSGDGQTRRHREWPDQSRSQRGPAGKEMSRDLKERANRVSRQGYVDEFTDGRRRRRRRKRQRTEEPQQKRPVAVLTHVKLPESLTVKEFAEAIKKTSAEVIMHLMKNGIMATANQELDFDTATIIASEFDITTEKLQEVTAEDILFDDTEDDVEKLEARPPVVVVMGHVDHGKTSLLDYIRKSEVTEGEAGGITQHIGAYMVTLNDRKITFLDTPGHEAFTTMRARGAQATDIAILVVAADDGVMPQTVEAISHARAAGTEIIVAINKIDKVGANPERVMQELSQHELISEDWGGDTIMVPVSALTGEGIDELLEMVLLSADILELKADPTRQAKGIIIEAKLDRHRGALATLLVQRGTLKQGDTIVTSSVVGNVRAMTDATGSARQEAGPSVPVEILGLPEVPEAGEVFYVVNDERVARQLAEKRRAEKREESISRAPTTTLESLFEQIEAGEIQDLNIIVKADVVGSVEAVTQSLEKLTSDEIRVNVIHGAAGAINESDIRLASASNAVVIGFNVRPTAQVSDLAKEQGVDIRLYSVIYSAIEDVEAAMKGMLAPVYKEEVLGQAEIRDTFKASSVGTIGGAYVTSGKILRNSDIRLLRDGVVIYEGKLASLRRFKDDVREVAQGYECGLSIERYNDIKVGDIVEAYHMKEVERD